VTRRHTVVRTSRGGLDEVASVALLTSPSVTSPKPIRRTFQMRKKNPTEQMAMLRLGKRSVPRYQIYGTPPFTQKKKKQHRLRVLPINANYARASGRIRTTPPKPTKTSAESRATHLKSRLRDAGSQSGALFQARAPHQNSGERIIQRKLGGANLGYAVPTRRTGSTAPSKCAVSVR
jgi:hypothetical protein